MAVASTQTWTMTIDEIVDEAQQRVTGELSTGYDARRSMRALNMLQQEFTLRGINLWRIDEVATAMTIGVGRVVLPTTVIDIIPNTALIRNTALTPTFDVTISRIAIDEYQNLPNKTATGQPVQFWLDRQRAAPEAVFWPVPDLTTYEFRYSAISKFYDAASLSGDADIPIRWIPAMVSGLAWYLARGNPKIDAARRAELLAEFERDYAFAAKEDRDTSGLRVLPDLSVYARCHG